MKPNKYQYQPPPGTSKRLVQFVENLSQNEAQFRLFKEKLSQTVDNRKRPQRNFIKSLSISVNNQDPNPEKISSPNDNQLPQLNLGSSTNRNVRQSMNSVRQSQTDLNSPIALDNGAFNLGKQYYFKFIHNRNQAMFTNCTLQDKAPSFVPFEAGRKVPINERVQYYIDKMINEEEEQKRQLQEKTNTIKIKSQVSINVNEDSQEELIGLTDVNASTSELPSISKAMDNSPLRGLGSPSRKNGTLLPSLIRNSGQNITDESDQQLTLRVTEKQQQQFLTKQITKRQPFKRDSMAIDQTQSKESLQTRESSSNLPSFRVARDSGQLVKNPSGMSPVKQQTMNPSKKITSTKNVRTLGGYGQNKGSTFSSSIIDREEQILTLLKDYKNQRFNTNEEGELIPAGAEIAERVFKSIAAEEGNPDGVNIKSLKLNKKRFKVFLSKLYNPKIADKISNIFDFINPPDLQGFQKQVEEIFIKSSQYHESPGKHLKILAFQLYDMNSDNLVCEYDMYSSIKNSFDSLFLTALHQDFKDLNQKFQIKQALSSTQNQPYEEWNNLKTTFKINNIQKYLKEKQKIMEVKKNFLQVFNTKNTGGTSAMMQQQQQQQNDNAIQNELEAQQDAGNTTQKNFNQTTKGSGFNNTVANPAAPTGGDATLKRKTSVGNLLKKAQDLYQSQEVVQLNLDEFSKEVSFQFGVPLLILDVFENLTGARIIAKIRESQQPPQSLVFFDTVDDELTKIKEKIPEDFYNQHIIPMFQHLGHHEFKDSRLATPGNIEGGQYLSLESIQKHMHRIFGASHNVFAEMFYNFLSDNIPQRHIPIKRFLKKFMIFWPVRKDPEEEENEEKKKKQQSSSDFYKKLEEEKQRKKDLNRIAFMFYDVDSDHNMNILDIIKMQTQFDDLSSIHREIALIMEEYKNVNIRPKYVKDRQIINFERFNQIVPDSCIIRELQHVLVDSFYHPQINYQNVFLPSRSNSESVNSQYVELKEKKKYYNYDSIFDKDLLKLKQE